MVFNTGAALLGCRSVHFGYIKICRRKHMGIKTRRMSVRQSKISESTLYPLLRRLQKDDCLETYDRAIDGRNRRYYKITEAGRIQLNLYRGEWNVYAGKISEILKEG